MENAKNKNGRSTDWFETKITNEMIDKQMHDS
jgi:hypothetical protein